MAIHKHAHSTLIDAVGTKIVVSRFGLSPQALWAWRTRGIPQIRRLAFAKLCADHGKVPPDDFFEKFHDDPAPLPAPEQASAA